MKTFKFTQNQRDFQIVGTHLQTSATGQTLIFDERGFAIAVVPVGILVYDIASIKTA